VTSYLCWRTCDVIVFTVKVKLQLNATNEIDAAVAADDDNGTTQSTTSSADIFEVTSHTHTLIDSDSPAPILK